MKKLFSTIFGFLLILLLPFSFVHASGKMELRLGEKVTLKVEEPATNATYKWVVKKDKEVITTQTGTVFTYTFEMQGEYTLNVSTTESEEDIRTTSITVMAGDHFKRPVEEGGEAPQGLSFTLETLPPLEKGRVELIDESTLLFNVHGSPDVLEYRIDQNIFEDSDANGTANDDIDNASSESYLRGGYFEAEYKPGTSTKVVAEVTAVSKTGEKAKKQVEIIFRATPSKETQPLVILHTIPAASPTDQIVYLYGESAQVGFYAERSEGNLAEYRIDKNIFFDSDSDGEAGNDIDNLDHPSFKTGDVWSTRYNKTDGQIIAQMTVVTPDGKGSRVQRELRFTDKPPASFDTYKGGIKLVADKPFVLQGDPIRFTVSHLQLSLDQYTFAWDVEGDGTVDKEVQGDNVLEHIFTDPGTFKTKVTVTDQAQNSGAFELETLVKEALATAADFEFSAEGNQVTFTNKSTAALNLANKTLQIQWSFGDTDEENYNKHKDQIGADNPVYTYIKASTYQVTLTVTDANDVTDSKTQEVVIGQDLAGADEEETEKTEEEEEEEEESAPEKAGDFSLLFKVLKILLYVLIIVVALVILFVGGSMLALKLQHPDLTFDELIDELKVKLLTKLGIHEEMIQEKPQAKAPAPAPAAATPKPAAAPQAPTPKAPEPKKEPEVLEGEVVEPKKENDEIVPPKHPPATGELAKPEGPVPDWLKGL